MVLRHTEIQLESSMALLDPTFKRKIYSWGKTEATARMEILTTLPQKSQKAGHEIERTVTIMVI